MNKTFDRFHCLLGTVKQYEVSNLFIIDPEITLIDSYGFKM